MRALRLVLTSSMRALRLAFNSSMRALRLAFNSSMRALRLAFCWIIRPASISIRVARLIPVPTMLLMIACVSPFVRTGPAAAGSGAAALISVA